MIAERILFEDKEIIVCHKPAGIATQTAALGQKDMVSLLKTYRAEKNEEAYIGPVNRLDQPVEGVIVFAKTPSVAAALSKQMAERDFGKEYYAVLEGSPREPKGMLEHWLCRDGKTNTSKVVNKNAPQAKRASLEYEVLEMLEQDGQIRSLVHVILHTGRHHQIRVQFAAMGCPIVGDRKYGKRENIGYEPLSLCSARLQFKHPKTGKEMDYTIVPEGKLFHQFSCQL